MIRKYSCSLLEAMDEGLIDPKNLVEALISYMSEDDVRGFCHYNQYDELFDQES